MKNKKQLNDYKPWEAPFYDAFPGQNTSKLVPIQIKPDGNIYVITSAEEWPLYAIFYDAWAGVTLTLKINPAIRKDAIEALINEVKPILQKFHTSYGNTSDYHTQENIRSKTQKAIEQIVKKFQNPNYLAVLKKP